MGTGGFARSARAVLAGFLVVGSALTAAMIGGVPSAAGASSDPVLEAWGGDNGMSLNGPDAVLSPSLPAGVTVTQIASDIATYFALTSTGTLYSWGDNSCGNLGDGTLTNRAAAAQVPFPSGVVITQVSAGEGDVIALDQTGTAWLWGCNAGNLVLGIPSEPDREPTPTALTSIPSGVQLTDVAIGETAAMAVGSDGNVYAWGNSRQGQLGQPTSGSGTFVPQVVPLPAGVVATSVATDGASGDAVTTTGALYTWGFNAAGECGCGTNGGTVAVALVSFPSGVSIASVSAGNQFVIARDTGGGVWSFGSNDLGQLGDGNASDSDVPVQVQLPTGISAAAIATNDSAVHALAVSTTGDLYAWGSNAAGQLGHFNGTSSDLPVLVDLGSGVTVSEIAATNGLSFALVQRSSQTVNFTSTAPSNAIFGGTYAAAATATSGLPVTLSIDPSASSVCSISGSSVSLTGVGTCVVDGDQGGNTSFDPATQVQQSFAVGQAPQSISFTSTAPSDATFGGTYVAAATATSGLPVTLSIDPSASSVCSISG
jgi:alpha-tubulin suppressor-like RCC1 family protein